MSAAGGTAAVVGCTGACDAFGSGRAAWDFCPNSGSGGGWNLSGADQTML